MQKKAEFYNMDTYGAMDDSKSNLITAEELSVSLSSTLSQFEPLVSQYTTVSSYPLYFTRESNQPSGWVESFFSMARLYSYVATSFTSYIVLRV